jgi:hypothetical protein
MDYFQPLSQKDLDRGMYFLQHKAMFIRLAWIAAILVIVGIYVALAFNVLRYVQAPSWLEISQNFKSNGVWSAYHQEKAPLEVELGQAHALTLGNGVYNLVATIKNPNADWLVSSLDYKFIINGQDLPVRTGFLNTADQHLLLQLGYKTDAPIGSVNVKIDNVRWQRLTNETPQISWPITDLKYQSASSVQVGGVNVALPTQVTWQAQNKSLFNFWEVGWQVALFANDNIVGVAEINERDFKSLEIRNIEANWAYNLPNATRAEVWPILNWLDKNNFKSAESNPNNQDRIRL